MRLNIFFKPAGNKLELLVRIPMSALREVDFPKRGPGYLIVSQADQALRNATRQWLIDSLDIYENDARLPAPRIVHARVTGNNLDHQLPCIAFISNPQKVIPANTPKDL